MTLIVEIGASNSESYATVAEADLYFSNRGEATWAALTEPQKEQNLRKATDYMTQIYRLRWKGSRVTVDQSLDWPRAYVERSDLKPQASFSNDFLYGIYTYPDNVIPNEVKNACIELALKASAGELSPDIERTGNVIAESVSGAVAVQYSDKSTPRFVVYRAIDNILAPLLKGAGTNFTVSRA